MDKVRLHTFEDVDEYREVEEFCHGVKAVWEYLMVKRGLPPMEIETESFEFVPSWGEGEERIVGSFSTIGWHVYLVIKEPEKKEQSNEEKG